MNFGLLSKVRHLNTEKQLIIVRPNILIQGIILTLRGLFQESLIMG